MCVCGVMCEMCTYSSSVSTEEIKHEYKPIPTKSVATEIGMTELITMTVLNGNNTILKSLFWIISQLTDWTSYPETVLFQDGPVLLTERICLHLAGFVPGRNMVNRS